MESSRKKIEFDFSHIEELYNIKMIDDVKEYFNSYWMMEINGKYNGYNIELEPIVPNKNLVYFENSLKEYFITHNNVLSYIPIGFEVEGFLVVINNESGEVFIEDHERNIYSKIAGSIREVINNL